MGLVLLNLPCADEGDTAESRKYRRSETPVVLQPGKQYFITQTCSKGMPDEFTNSAANAGTADGACVGVAAVGTCVGGTVSSGANVGDCVGAFAGPSVVGAIVGAAVIWSPFFFDARTGGDEWVLGTCTRHAQHQFKPTLFRT